MEHRKSNIELFRIILMFFIVLYHYFNHGLSLSSAQFSSNTSVLYLLTFFGPLSVLAFFMISGYFQSTKSFNLSSFIKLIFETCFYVILLYSVYLIYSKNPFSFKELGYNLLNYWFPLVYLSVYLFSPALNAIIKSASKKEAAFFFSVMLVFCLLSLLFPTNTISAIIYACFGYLVGGFLAKFDVKINGKIRLVGILSLAFSIVSTYAGLFYSVSSGKEFSSYLILFLYKSPFALLINTWIFLEFQNMRIRSTLWINFPAQAVFGVYFLHDSLSCYDFLWQKCLMVNDHYAMGVSITIGHSIVSALLILSLGILLDLLRKYCLERPLFRLLDRPISFFQKKLDELPTGH